ncbi:S66 peptidase family protein [Adhaeribacter soli]|uniref:LD-carboxypeptidase n=1 Tax=Adhaeribacter soli TaxID=2607655 RepID=A0A5N1J4H6_9BACT|nr:LD-carboxypeptidase [Adhaeribacter soli]KAA9340975.1 LD-carboxypeptidase [Adhaeribacter soli]
MKNLQPGDKIAIVSTARKVSSEEMQSAISVLQSWGLEVVLGETVGADFHQFAGPDELRRNDLQRMLDDPSIKAILCARGGYGTARILDHLDFTKFAQNPKLIIGFSDVTALHAHLYKLGFESLHAIMPILFPREGSEAAIESLRRILFGDEISYNAPIHPFNRFGTAEGELVGGNLSILHTIIGTRSDFDYSGKILFLEDLDEYLYHIDRMLVHLDRCGKLENLAGLIIGHMSDMKDNTIPFGRNAYEIIREHTARYNYPVCFDFPVGHEAHNLALVCGRKVKLEVGESGSELNYI